MQDKQPVRAAFFMPNLKIGGAERVMSHLASSFADHAIRTDFVLVRSEGPFIPQLSKDIRIVNLGLSSTVHSFGPLIYYLRTMRPEVFISALDLTNLVALAASQVSRVPTRIAIRIDSTISIQRRSNFIKKWLERVLLTYYYPQASYIIAVSNGVAEDLAKYTGISIHKIKTIYNPIILPELVHKQNEWIDHDWLHPGQPPVILGIGRLTYSKNFELLVRAFSIVRARTPARLIILGDGEERPMLEELVISLGLQDFVYLPGNISNPYAYMSRASVFVLSSRYEGLPTVLVEALACGCQVVSTDCPNGPAEILDRGKFGHLVPTEDEIAMAEAIYEVLMGRGRQVSSEWLQQFELEPVVHQYLRVLGLT